MQYYFHCVKELPVLENSPSDGSFLTRSVFSADKSAKNADGSSVPEDVRLLSASNNARVEFYVNFHKRRKLCEIAKFRMFSRIKKFSSAIM